MGKVLKKIGIISSLASRYIGIIIIAFSCLAFFWRDGFSWMTNYTSVFLGVIMFGMGLTIKLDDFRAIFSRPKEVVIGAVAQYTIMPVIAWLLCKVMNLPADLALGVILVGSAVQVQKTLQSLTGSGKSTAVIAKSNKQ